MTTTGEVLKPCPWCESTNIATQPDDAQGTKWGFAYCADCGVRGPEVRTGYKLADDAPWRLDAIAAWNRRAPQGNAAQEGYVLVPVEITDEMEQAIFSELGSPSDWHGFKEAYRAMIAAAPSNKEVER